MAGGDDVSQLSTVGTFFRIWTWHMYFADIDISNTDNEIFSTVLANPWNKEQNSVKIEMHEVLMTEYVHVCVCIVKHCMQKINK